MIHTPMLATLLSLVFCSAGLEAAERSLVSLSAPARDLATASTAFMDAAWDESAGLCWGPNPSQVRKRHIVRETGWYAIGLLLRNGKGDTARVSRAITTVINNQFDEPDRSYHGTFARSPEDPRPTGDAGMFKGYDPNWRQFIGTVFAVILREYEDRLPAELIGRMEESIRKALVGEEKQGRLKASYTNISLMHAFLLDYAGMRLKNPGFTKRGNVLAEEIYGLFKETKAFQEYNAPTYYGVDLYALALWRTRAPSPRLRELGASMEADLWRDIARFYHAGLKNLAGPFTRAYGMDMPTYVGLTGLYFWESLGRRLAPFPMPDQPEIRMSQDFMWGPVLALAGTKIPADALRDLKAFRGERQVERVITTSPRFVATAWIGKNVILGAESTSGKRGAGGQFCPVTAHWKTPAGPTGWIRLFTSPPIDAQAQKNRITMSAAGDSVFRIKAPGAKAASLGRDVWKLPGLTVRIKTDAKTFNATDRDDYIEVEYGGATKLVLETASTL